MNKTVIQIHNVSKTYKDLKAVSNLSFKVEKSKCYGLLGPNGAGKTTMLKMLYGKARRDNHEHSNINIFGYDPCNNELEIKQISGIVPQENNLDLELSVLQNLLIYARFYGLINKPAINKIEKLLNFMELSEKKNSKIKHLSGGMKRRLVFVRALLNSPKLLILDEPTTGLDPQVRHLIWDKLIFLKNSGVTMLLTTHYMAEASQLCDDIVIMHKGKQVLEGNPKDLINSNIEKHVLEIKNKIEINTSEIDNTVRFEKTSNRILLYSDEFEKLKCYTKTLTSADYYLRQSNLEDVFLKSTGRELNE